MGSEGRAADPDLTRQLIDEAHEFSLFQLIRLLERLNRDGAAIGTTGPAVREGIRLRPPLSFAFPHSEVAGIVIQQREPANPRYLIETPVLGLYGSQSPLPSYFTEEMLQDHEADESIAREFLDLFHHRILSLLYRCWVKYRHFVQFRPQGNDSFSRRMFSLIGMAFDGERYGVIPPQRLIRYSGNQIQKPVSAAALRGVINDYFSGVPTEITQNIFRWVRIPPRSRCRLGSVNSTLGRDLYLGRRIPDRAGKFRVTLGPVGYVAFVDFLPGEPEFLELDEIVRRFVNDMLQFEVEVVMIRREVPALELRIDRKGARLGYTSWLGKPPRDGKVVFQETRRWPQPDSASGDPAVAA